MLFSDNEAALSSLTRGRSHVPPVRKMLEMLFDWEESHDINVWFERVPGASNPADNPSSGVFSGLPASTRVRLSCDQLVNKLCLETVAAR